MNTVLIVGGSARAAAQSVSRAGHLPLAIDAFGDRDFETFSGTIVGVEKYPSQVAEVTRRFPASDWLYTGALENHPQIIADISTRHHLLGIAPENLMAVRDPKLLFNHLRAEQIAVPHTVWTIAELANIEPSPSTTANSSHALRWLRKPRRSGGGLQIHWYHGQTSRALVTADEQSESLCYWQEYIAGESYGAVFLAAGGEAVLWGVTQQFVGRDWPQQESLTQESPEQEPCATGQSATAKLLTRANFDYAGSIGPVALPTAVEKEIERIGKTIARWGQLSGIFGVDLIIKSVSPPTDVATSLVVSKASSDSSDRATTFQVFVLEVNPRWTASVEILERATGENAFLLHQAACAQSPRRTPFARATSTLHGKLVVYAQEAFLVSAANSDRWVDRIRGRAWPALADIPRAGESIPAGAPICTVFASGLTMADVRAQLQAARAEIRSDLSGS